mmetsp:Transcript_9305/g.18338  ORF Transcript_9305/g.18338 Transcript_9305/m.18338 type:complete len:640 (-) Transcript_9305:104-2023(-)
MDHRKVFKARGSSDPDAGEHWRRACHESMLQELQNRGSYDDQSSRLDGDDSYEEQSIPASSRIDRRSSRHRRFTRRSIDRHVPTDTSATINDEPENGSTSDCVGVGDPAQSIAEEPDIRSSLIRARSTLGKRVSKRLARLKQAARKPRSRSRFPGIDSHVAPVGDLRPSHRGSFTALDAVRRPSNAQDAVEDQDDETRLWLYVSMLQDDPTSDQIEGARGIRELLSRPENPPIQLVVQSGILSRMVELLERDQVPEALTYEILWGLSNVASSTTAMTDAIVEALAVPAIIHIIIHEPSERVYEQGIWCISNICGDSRAHRDLVYDSFPIPALLTTLKSSLNRTNLRVNVWFLANFLRFDPYPFRPKEFMPVLRILESLAQSTDTDIFTDTCWALTYIMSNEDKQWRTLVLSRKISVVNIVQKFANLEFTAEIEAALAFLSISTQEGRYMSATLQQQLLNDLPPVLRHVRQNFRQSAIEIVLNTTRKYPDIVRDSDVLGACFELLGDQHEDISKVAVELVYILVVESDFDMKSIVDLAERGALEGVASYLRQLAQDGMLKEDQEAEDVEQSLLLPLRVIEVFLMEDLRRRQVLGFLSFPEACRALEIPESLLSIATWPMFANCNRPSAELAQSLAVSMQS